MWQKNVYQNIMTKCPFIFRYIGFYWIYSNFWNIQIYLISFIYCPILLYLRGSYWAKIVKMIKFLFFAQESVFRYGGITSQIFRGLAALEPLQNGGKGGVRFFFVFNRKRKIKWKKYFVHFVGNLSTIPKLFFFILA